jgi:hypothetical protein
LYSVYTQTHTHWFSSSYLFLILHISFVQQSNSVLVGVKWFVSYPVAVKALSRINEMHMCVCVCVCVCVCMYVCMYVSKSYTVHLLIWHTLLFFRFWLHKKEKLKNVWDQGALDFVLSSTLQSLHWSPLLASTVGSFVDLLASLQGLLFLPRLSAKCVCVCVPMQNTAICG